jgi:hypothetical protein
MRSDLTLAGRLRLWAGALVLLLGAARPSPADVLVEGQVYVKNVLQIEWGPLAGHLARPVAAKEGDTWERLAERECGDAAWAAAVREMNGGAERPKAGAASAWVPPKGQKRDSDAVWYSAYSDSSKFGADETNDISRTGFQRFDPAAAGSAFGWVTVAVLPHKGAENARTSAEIASRRAAEVLKTRAKTGLVLCKPWEVVSSIEKSSPVRTIETTWRCTGVGAEGLGLAFVREVRKDEKGTVLSTREADAAPKKGGAPLWAGPGALGDTGTPGNGAASDAAEGPFSAFAIVSVVLGLLLIGAVTILRRRSPPAAA